jgi:hypothetical protein
VASIKPNTPGPGGWLVYIGGVSRIYYLPLLIGILPGLRAAEIKPEAAAAFDRYVKLTEDGFAKNQGYENFLWLDHHPKEKTLIWLQQSTIVPQQTLDAGKEIEVPGGMIQHWLGLVYLEKATLEKVHVILMNFNEYHNMIPLQVMDSKTVKTEGDQTEAFLRLYKKQVSAVVLNVKGSAKYTLLDPTRAVIAFHSTSIGEVEHARKKKTYDQERSPEDAAGYLWRLNYYVRLHEADNGVYVEIEMITLGREEGGRIGASRARVMNGFQSFPQELTQGFIAALEYIYPNKR